MGLKITFDFLGGTVPSAGKVQFLATWVARGWMCQQNLKWFDAIQKEYFLLRRASANKQGSKNKYENIERRSCHHFTSSFLTTFSFPPLSHPRRNPNGLASWALLYKPPKMKALSPFKSADRIKWTSDGVFMKNASHEWLFLELRSINKSSLY